MNRKSSTRLWLTAPVLVGVAVFLSPPLFSRMLTAFEVNMAPQPADVIVVLGSDINCDLHQPDAVGTLRIDKGLALFRAGYATRMTVTDADTVRPRGCPTMGDIEKAYIKRKLAANTQGLAMFVLEHANDTHQEAAHVASLARQHGWRKILLVSSPLHLRRSVMLFSQTGLTVIPVASDESRYNPHFLTLHDRRIAMQLMIHELLGFIQAIVILLTSAVSQQPYQLTR